MTRGRRWALGFSIGVFVVAVALLIAQDQDTLHVSSPIAAGSAAFPEYVGSLVGAPVTLGDRWRVLQNGDEFYPAMLSAIDAATRRISFETFIYSPGRMAQRFTRSLTEAAGRGVGVRMVLDAIGAADLGRDELDSLQKAGVVIRWFNPLRPWQIEETNYRTHRKTLVVDGSVGFTGGAGVADHWMGDARHPEEWRDTNFEVTGPATRALEAAFYENWLESGGREAPALDPDPPAPQTDARTLVVWSNANSGASSVKMLYLLSIAGARERIDIQSPYFIVDRSTFGALRAARERGVRIRVLTESDQTDAKPVKDASRSAYEALLSNGLELFEYVPTMMHVKTMVVDGTWSVFGSANFDNRSFELNDELTVAVADRELARTLTEAFEADLAASRAITLDQWRARPVTQRVQQYFWSVFSELF